MCIRDSGFSFNFELSLQKANLTYGYVCRIVSNDVETLDLVGRCSIRYSVPGTFSRFLF